MIRPIHRAVDPRPRPPEHPPLAVAEREDQQLRLPPRDADLAAVLHPLAFLGRDLGADPDPSAIDLSDDVLPGHLLTPRELTVTEPLQGTGPCRQHLGTPLPDHAVDGLLIEGRPLVTEFLAGQLDRGEHGGQAAHLPVQGRGGSLPDAQEGQLGRGSGPLAAPTPAGAQSRATGNRSHPDNHSAQESEFQPPRLRWASRLIGAAGAPFFQAQPGPPRSWLRPGGWRSPGRRGDGSGHGSRVRVVRSWPGHGSTDRATAVSRHRVAGSTSRGSPPGEGRGGRAWIGYGSPWSPPGYWVTDSSEAMLSRPKSNYHFLGVDPPDLRFDKSVNTTYGWFDRSSGREPPATGAPSPTHRVGDDPRPSEESKHPIPIPFQEKAIASLPAADVRWGCLARPSP